MDQKPEKPATSAGSKTSKWQNSLSRMSNKFNLFASASQHSTLKQQLARKRPSERPDDEQRPTADGDQIEVVLDAWIEAKMVSGTFGASYPRDACTLCIRQTVTQLLMGRVS